MKTIVSVAHNKNSSRRKHVFRSFVCLFLCVLLWISVFLCTGCTAAVDFLPDRLQRVRLQGEEKSMVIPLSYDAECGLELEADMRFDDGGSNPITVYPLPDGKEPSAVITYPDDLEKYGFYAENEGNILRIGTQAKHRFDTDAFRITVYADVSAYRLTGGLELHADAGNTAMPALSLTVTGGADCSVVNIEADEVTLHVDGAADISLAGNTALLTGTINGAADMDCVSLHAHSAALTVNGAGAAAVNVTDRLDVEINGAGSVTYLGSPAVNKTIRGAGSVAAADGSRDGEENGSGSGSMRAYRERERQNRLPAAV